MALTKRYPADGVLSIFRGQSGSRLALAGIDLCVPRGALFGLLGPNGAGKTTAVKILSTLLLPSSGSVRVLGLDVERDARRIRERIGLVLGGERGLYGRLSALDNLTYFAHLYSIPAQVRQARIRELLELVGLTSEARTPVERFSRGMKQRLHLARGLLADPELVFLDEPTSGMDPEGARTLRSLVRELVARGKSIVLTTHYLLEAEVLCDRLAVIARGRIVAEGTVDSLKRESGQMGIVEFETEAMTDDELAPLRSCGGVRQVTVSQREAAQVITLHTPDPATVAAQIPRLAVASRIHNLRTREATLEDAYLQLVE